MVKLVSTPFSPLYPDTVKLILSQEEFVISLLENTKNVSKTKCFTAVPLLATDTLYPMIAVPGSVNGSVHEMLTVVELI